MGFVPPPLLLRFVQGMPEISAIQTLKLRARGLYEIATGRGQYSAQERNIGLLYLDIIAASVLSAAASFNGAFALRLGASNFLIGVMNSLPALVTMLGMVPASGLLESRTRRWALMLRSLLVTRILFLPFCLIPWLVPAPWRALAFVLLVSVRFVTVLPFAAGFDSVLAEVVTPNLRAQVFSWRNILATGTIVVFLALARPWLQLAPFPANYALVYALGGLAGMVSYHFVAQLSVPEFQPALPAGRTGWAASINMAREALRTEREYRRFAVNSLLGSVGAYLASPLYVILYVKGLGASDGWIATSTLLANLAAMVGFYLFRRLLPRVGESLCVKVLWPIIGLLPLAVGLLHSLDAILAVIFLHSLLAPGLNLSHYNILLEVCPRERRALYISTFSALANALAFALPLAAVALADVVGVRQVLISAGVLWVSSGLLFTVNPVRVPDTSRQGPAPQR